MRSVSCLLGIVQLGVERLQCLLVAFEQLLVLSPEVEVDNDQHDEDNDDAEEAGQDNSDGVETVDLLNSSTGESSKFRPPGEALPWSPRPQAEQLLSQSSPGSRPRGVLHQ